MILIYIKIFKKNLIDMKKSYFKNINFRKLKNLSKNSLKILISKNLIYLKKYIIKNLF